MLDYEEHGRDYGVIIELYGHLIYWLENDGHVCGLKIIWNITKVNKYFVIFLSKKYMTLNIKQKIISQYTLNSEIVVEVLYLHFPGTDCCNIALVTWVVSEPSCNFFTYLIVYDDNAFMNLKLHLSQIVIEILISSRWQQSSKLVNLTNRLFLVKEFSCQVFL